MTMPPQLTFGYLYDFRNPEPWRRPWADLYAEMLDFAAYTETLGFDGAWVPEHHVSDDGYVSSPFVALGAMAARTKSIKLGTAIALAPYHHPLRFAEDCALLDVLSNGRLEIGVAVGYRRREAQAFGIDFSTRGKRTDEFLDIVKRLWAGETVSFKSKHFTLENAAILPRPLRDHVPLYLGGFTEKALERAAKYGDGYFGNEEVCDLYRAKLSACGTDPAAARIRIQGLFVLVAKDPEKALHELAPHFHYVNNAYGKWQQEDQHSTGFGDAVALKPLSLDAFKAGKTLRILTPDQAIAFFQAMRARIPVEHFMMMVPPGFPLAKFAEYADLFAKDVMPAFR